MCIIACLGSPIVADDIAFDQRSVLLVLLVAAAMAGEHHGQSYVRVADALFVLLSGWAIVLVFVFRTPARPRRPAPGASLSGALLTYVGLRAVRAGMTHANEASNFSVEAFEFETKGYALGDGVVAVAITFGGSMLACTGVIVIFNAALVQKLGTFAISPVVAMNTSFVFVSAFVAQISFYEHLEDLKALFSGSACSGGRESCAAAYRARRLHVANSSPASLWTGCVAATVLSMPKQRRCPSRTDYYATSKLSTTSCLVTILVAVIAAVAVLRFASNDSVFAQVELMFLFLSIPLAWFGTTSAACAVNVTGNLLYMDRRLTGTWGFDLCYFTHWSLLVTTVLVSLIGLSTLVQRVVYIFDKAIVTFDGGSSEFLAAFTGALTVAVLSVQFALTLLTLSLIAGYDGELVTSEISWRTAGYEFTVQHSLTFFFAAAVYGSRYETGDLHGISVSLRLVMWYTTPLLVVVAWGVTLMLPGNESPYTQMDESWGLVTGIVSAVVPWLVTGVEI